MTVIEYWHVASGFFLKLGGWADLTKNLDKQSKKRAYYTYINSISNLPFLYSQFKKNVGCRKKWGGGAPTPAICLRHYNLLELVEGCA